MLAHRQLCDQQTLADVFGVSRGTIRNAIDDVLPLLQQDGHLPPRVARCHASAAELLKLVGTALTDQTPS